MDPAIAELMATARQFVEGKLLLHDAERRAIKYTDAERETVCANMRAADARVAAARELTSPSLAPVVASLYRDAIDLRLVAAAVGRDEMELAELRREVDKMAPANAERRLRRESEPRSLANIRATRYGRIAAAALAVLYVVGLPVMATFAAPNVALHRVVVTSGIFGRAPAAELVDGVRDMPEPVRVMGSPPMIDIDLGGVYAIDSIRITNRMDRHFDSSLPLTLLVAERADDWHELGKRRLHFRSFSMPGDRARGRFVRVTGGSRDLALNEIEVFGRYAGHL